jgi:hypothetical protein
MFWSAAVERNSKIFQDFAVVDRHPKGMVKNSDYSLVEYWDDRYKQE